MLHCKKTLIFDACVQPCVLCAVSNRPRYFCCMLVFHLCSLAPLLFDTSVICHLCYLAAVTTNPTEKNKYKINTQRNLETPKRALKASFREQYIKNKVEDWVKHLQLLSYYAQGRWYSSRVKQYQCYHFTLRSFPYNKNEKSLHFPTQSETKNAIIFSYNIWSWNTTYYIPGADPASEVRGGSDFSNIW